MKKLNIQTISKEEFDSLTSSGVFILDDNWLSGGIKWVPIATSDRKWRNYFTHEGVIVRLGNFYMVDTNGNLESMKGKLTEQDISNDIGFKEFESMRGVSKDMTDAMVEIAEKHSNPDNDEGVEKVSFPVRLLMFVLTQALFVGLPLLLSLWIRDSDALILILLRWALGIWILYSLINGVISLIGGATETKKLREGISLRLWIASFLLNIPLQLLISVL